MILGWHSIVKTINEFESTDTEREREKEIGKEKCSEISLTV